MNLSLSEILYAYAYHNIEIDESTFYDEHTKEFIRAMKRMPYESITGCEMFGEISPQIISKEYFVEQYNTMIYSSIVNEKTAKLQMDLLSHNWLSLSEAFPETQSQAFRVNNIKNPQDLILEDYTFYNFFPEWDKGFRGLRDDDFIVFFAPPKHGKSTITAFLAYKAIKAGIPIGFYPTELTLSVTLKYILGFEYGCRGDESLAFFDGYKDENGIQIGGHKKEFNELLAQYNHLIYLPPSNRFNYNDYEALYESPAKFIFHDNFVKSAAHLGLEETPTNFSQLSRKLSDIQHKHKKTTFLATQETMREASPKELEGDPDTTEIGKGYTFMSRTLLQESSLALNIKKKSHSQIRKLVVKNDRFRGLSDFNNQMFAEITNRGTLKVTVEQDAMVKNLEMIERNMLAKSQKEFV